MNGRNHHQCSRKFKWAGGKTILEAPARTGTAFGFEGNDEETASSFGRSSHADTDRKTLDLADQTIGPSCGRWRVPGERQSDASDGTIMIHRLQTSVTNGGGTPLPASAAKSHHPVRRSLEHAYPTVLQCSGKAGYGLSSPHPSSAQGGQPQIHPNHPCRMAPGGHRRRTHHH